MSNVELGGRPIADELSDIGTTGYSSTNISPCSAITDHGLIVSGVPSHSPRPLRRCHGVGELRAGVGRETEKVTDDEGHALTTTLYASKPGGAPV